MTKYRIVTGGPCFDKNFKSLSAAKKFAESVMAPCLETRGRTARWRSKKSNLYPRRMCHYYEILKSTGKVYDGCCVYANPVN